MHFNLAENRGDADAPFAFLATYTTQLTAQARAQHVPLGQALREYAGAANREKLLALLLPVQRAAETCDWLRPMLDAGELYHPLRWTPREASRLLASVPDLERAGVVVRMPPSWRANRPPRPQVTGTVGARKPSALGLEGVLDFRMAVTLDGETLSAKEIAALLSGTDSLVLLRGQWVEIDRERLERSIRQFREAEELAEREGLTFAAAMRMLAGAAVADDASDVAVADWSRVTAGPVACGDAAKAALARRRAMPIPIRRCAARCARISAPACSGCDLLSGLGLGACLADDMGLGKTIQVLALLLARAAQRAEPAGGARIAAGQLGGGGGEIRARPEGGDRASVGDDARSRSANSPPARAAELDLAITSYGSLLRIKALSEIEWRYAILDEAQAIKNPNAKQTRAAKALKATARIALTGTPVENHLGDLWSIFDFINPGLLGSAKQFSRYAKTLADRENNPYGPLRELVRPYILRRMKTDKTIIGDLPDKTEVKAWCGLSRRQAALYEQAVRGAGRRAGGQRRHPAQGHRAGDADAAQADLQPSLAVAARQRLGGGGQRQAGAPARDRRGGRVAAGEDAGVHPVPRDDRAAGDVPGRRVRPPGPGAARRDRGAQAARPGATFQEDETVPFFVLSLKAGGSGLDADRGLARGALRPLVEPGGGEPGDRPRLPHRPEAQRAGAQVRLPRHGRGEDRRIDRIEAGRV